MRFWIMMGFFLHYFLMKPEYWEYDYPDSGCLFFSIIIVLGLYADVYEYFNK